MKNIQILDCTLRDGGRIIDCAFKDEETRGIVNGLTNAKVDIVELGFLRNKITYEGNSTFFTNVEQMRQFVDPSRQNTMYVAFTDFGMFDYETLSPCDGTSITGVRVGFTKGQLDDARKAFDIVKEKGYKLFVQGVNSLSYTDKELLEMVEVMNEVQPYSFGIVDTYGAMYIDDFSRIYDLVNHNLDESICIDFHSHNNFQLSFSFAIEIIKRAQLGRKVIIDGTLDGMGKGAGNLNTELVIDYLARIYHYNYDFDILLDTIDEYLFALKEREPWGYSIPSLMAGIYKSHPNNIIYLTEKFRIDTKDIKHIISMIEPKKRQGYDYDNIEKLYIEYNANKVYDQETIDNLRQMISGRKVVVLVPGKSLKDYSEKIQEVIAKENPVIISVNFVYGKNPDTFAFFGNQKRYHKCEEKGNINVIISSNIQTDSKKDYVVNYHSIINRGYKYFDNSTLMLLNLLRRIEVEDIMIAGFDGFSEDGENNYYEKAFDNNRYTDVEKINSDLTDMLKEYAVSLVGDRKVEFITPSIFESVFKK